MEVYILQKRGCVALDTPSVLFRICILSYQMITNLGFDQSLGSKRFDLVGLRLLLPHLMY